MVAVTPDGKSVYVTNLGNGSGNTLSQYNVDPLTGTLSPKTPATVATGLGPYGVAVTPDDKSAYVTNIGDQVGLLGNALAQYNVDPLTGTLSTKTPATVATGAGPQGIAVTPDAKNAYVSNVGDKTVSQYSTNALTGALSPTTPATVATGSGPTDVAVGPLPALSLQVTITTIPASRVGRGALLVPAPGRGRHPALHMEKVLAEGPGLPAPRAPPR
jgi:6-phosphogluconolactonase